MPIIDGWSAEQFSDLIKDALRKAMTDSEFRQLLLTDATAALTKIAGRPLPSTIEKMVFTDFTDKSVELIVNEKDVHVIHLPDFIASEELTEEELEKVAGGGQCGITIITNCCLSCTLGLFSQVWV